MRDSREACSVVAAHRASLQSYEISTPVRFLARVFAWRLRPVSAATHAAPVRAKERRSSIARTMLRAISTCAAHHAAVALNAERCRLGYKGSRRAWRYARQSRCHRPQRRELLPPDLRVAKDLVRNGTEAFHREWMKGQVASPAELPRLEAASIGAQTSGRDARTGNSNCYRSGSVSSG